MMIVAAAGTIITVNTTTVRRMIVMRVYNESEIIRNNDFNPNLIGTPNHNRNTNSNQEW